MWSIPIALSLLELIDSMDVDRAEGVLLGLACGDALGRPVEFKSPREIEGRHGQLTEMVGNGTWSQPAGIITDDTEQALCIARSLNEYRKFDPADIATRFVQWYETGPFDIGIMTRKSLQALQSGDSWEQAGELVWKNSQEGENAGNGSVMRSPPLALMFFDEPKRLIESSRHCSRITHADPRCTYGCAVLNLTIAGILRDESSPLETALDKVRKDAPNELIEALDVVVHGDAPSLSTSGYVIDTLQTALHDGLGGADAEDAIVTAVNRGGDADTIGAITGAVAGARFGAESLPARWVAALDERDELEGLAAGLVN